MLMTLIKSCAKHAARRRACRGTWLQTYMHNGYPYKFITGPGVTDEPDTWAYAGAPDDFSSIAPKLALAFEQTIRQGFTHALVVDDDTYARYERVDRSGWELVDYMGYLRVAPGIAYNQDIPYAQGSAYIISARGMGIAVRSGLLGPKVIDDGAVGRALIDRVHFVHNHNFEVGPNRDRQPLRGNQIISTHKCLPDQMQEVHTRWEASIRDL